MEDKLIEILESYGYPVRRQGSLAENEEYPDGAIRKADRHIVAVINNIFRFIEKFLLFEIRHLSTIGASTAKMK